MSKITRPETLPADPRDETNDGTGAEGDNRARPRVEPAVRQDTAALPDIPSTAAQAVAQAAAEQAAAEQAAAEQTAAEQTAAEQEGTTRAGAIREEARAGRGRFPALRHRNFRLFWGGNLLSLIGTLAQQTAQGWLTRTLTH